MSQFRCQATRVLSSLRKGSTFLSIRDYENVGTGKVAHWSVSFHFSYHNALAKSIEIVKQASLIDFPYSYSTMFLAREELIDRWSESLIKEVEPGEYYSWIEDEEGELIPGIKVCINQDLIHLFGLVIRQTVIVPGREVYRSGRELTLAKKALEKITPLARFVQFRLEPKRFSVISVEQLSFSDREVLRGY